MARRLEVQIVGSSRDLERAFGRSAAAASGFGTKIGRAGKITGAAFVGIGAAAIAAGGKIVSMASDAAEVQSKLEVVFARALPGLTKHLDAFSEATGASKFALREQVADMGALLEPLTSSKKAAADMSGQFVKLATDLGSFNNVPVADALLAIRSGLVGESEPLRRFGVLLNEAAVSAEGVRLGLIKAGQEMTEQEKVQARASLIMKQTALAQGDATRTAGSMANQLKALRNNVSDAATSLGQMLIPAALTAVTAFNEHWPQIRSVVETVATAVFAATSATASFIREQVVPVVRDVVAFVRAHWPQISETARNVFNSVVGILSSVVSIIRALWGRFGANIVASARATWQQISGQIKGAMEVIRGIVNIIGGLLEGDFSRVWTGIKQVFGGALTSILATLRGMVTQMGIVARALGKAILDGISAGVSALAGLVARELGELWGFLRGAAGTALQRATAIGEGILDGIVQGLADLVARVKGALDRLWGIISNVAGLARTAAVAIGSAIITGIASGLVGLAESVAGKVVGGIRSGLGKAAGLVRGISIPGLSPIPHIGSELIAKPIADGAQEGILKYLGPSLVKAIRASLGAAAAAVGNATGPLKDSALKGLNEVGQAIVAAARKYGVDARAALAVAMGEGGIKFGAVGDSGTSFGPFQLHIGGASPFSDPAKAAQFANSIAGIEYAIRKMAETGARGKSGIDAINAIVRNFERPLDPDSSVRNAVARYATIPTAIGNAVASAGPIVGTAVQGQLAQIAAKVKEVAPKIGLEKARGIVAGFLQAAPTLTQQIKQALGQAASEAVKAMQAKVAEARSGLASAFSGLASVALAAFDAQVGKWKAPSLVKLEGLQLKETAQRLKDDIAKAAEALGGTGAPGEAPLGGAKAALNEALAGGDPEKIKEAQAAVLQAQEAFEAAVRAQRDFNLQQAAQKETEAHAQRMERKRVQFEAELEQARIWQAEHPKLVREGQRRILAVLKEYLGDYKASGSGVGYAIAAGLDESIRSVEEAARRVAAAIARYLKMNSPAEKGPLSDLDTWAKGFAPTWLKSLGVGQINRALADLALASPRSTPAFAAAGGLGGGGVTVNVHVDGALLGSTVPEVAETIRRELHRTQRRNGTVGLT